MLIMKPGTFSNAMVATVGAYAEALAELAAQNEQLQTALRVTAAQTPMPVPSAVKHLAEQVTALLDEVNLLDPDNRLAKRRLAVSEALDAIMRRGAP